MKEKIKEFINRRLTYVICGGALLTTAIVVIIFLVLGGKDGVNNETEGIMHGIPEFSGECCASDTDFENYTALYYESVTSEQVAEYVSKIENECGVEFSGAKYPRCAVYGERLITIHYNVTEKKLSVTVTNKTPEN